MTDGELSSILAAAEIAPAPALSPQDVTRSSLALAIASTPADPVSHPRKILFEANDPEVQVRAWAGQAMDGRELAGKPVWVRLYRADGSQGLLAVLHAFNTPGEMELVLIGHRGMICGTALRFLAAWAFHHVGAVGLQRIVVRVPASADGLQDYARRAGFRFEGTARAFFPPDTDASVWAMTRADCPWLRPSGRRASEPSFPSLPAGQVH